MAKIIHPLLATRGPPGSHDINLAIEILRYLKLCANDTDIKVPRFDKIADDQIAQSDWPSLKTPVDIILFEGWFLGVQPQAPSHLSTPINVLEREQDPNAIWRNYCNHALAAYAPLWALFDRLIMLQGPSFELVAQWRWQQELSLQAANPDRQTMSYPQVQKFILFFERVSNLLLEQIPHRADYLIRLDQNRRPL